MNVESYSLRFIKINILEYFVNKSILIKTSGSNNVKNMIYAFLKLNNLGADIDKFDFLPVNVKNKHLKKI